MDSTGKTSDCYLAMHFHAVDGRNPANQLRLVVYPIIYRVLYINRIFAVVALVVFSFRRDGGFFLLLDYPKQTRTKSVICWTFFG